MTRLTSHERLNTAYLKPENLNIFLVKEDGTRWHCVWDRTLLLFCLLQNSPTLVITLVRTEQNPVCNKKCKKHNHVTSTIQQRIHVSVS